MQREKRTSGRKKRYAELNHKNIRQVHAWFHIELICWLPPRLFSLPPPAQLTHNGSFSGAQKPRRNIFSTFHKYFPHFSFLLLLGRTHSEDGRKNNSISAIVMISNEIFRTRIMLFKLLHSSKEESERIQITRIARDPPPQQVKEKQVKITWIKKSLEHSMATSSNCYSILLPIYIQHFNIHTESAAQSLDSFSLPQFKSSHYPAFQSEQESVVYSKKKRITWIHLYSCRALIWRLQGEKHRAFVEHKNYVIALCRRSVGRVHSLEWAKNPTERKEKIHREHSESSRLVCFKENGVRALGKIKDTTSRVEHPELRKIIASDNFKINYLKLRESFAIHIYS